MSKGFFANVLTVVRPRKLCRQPCWKIISRLMWKCTLIALPKMFQAVQEKTPKAMGNDELRYAFTLQNKNIYWRSWYRNPAWATPEPQLTARPWGNRLCEIHAVQTTRHLRLINVLARRPAVRAMRNFVRSIFPWPRGMASDRNKRMRIHLS